MSIEDWLIGFLLVALALTWVGAYVYMEGVARGFRHVGARLTENEARLNLLESLSKPTAPAGRGRL